MSNPLNNSEIRGNRRCGIVKDKAMQPLAELMSVYRDGELDIHPEFQRFFRWTPLQKSKFIESILLGIPVPSIFVSQREDGVWDVVDGVQRLSTIFEFVGILRNEKKEQIPASTLVGTDYLPSLDGRVWEDPSRPKQEFPSSLRLNFKRQKLDLKIIKKESDPNTKYDLFERLNTLGSQLRQKEEGRIMKSKMHSASTFGCFSGFLILTS